MKKVFFAICVALLPIAVMAQSERRPILDITANPKAWSEQQANICAQVMAIPQIGLCFSGNFSVSEGIQGSFFAQSANWNFHSELRFFPFGKPGSIKFRDKLLPWQKRNQGKGCWGLKKNFFGKLASSAIRSVYIAPGYMLQRQDLDLIPSPEIESPIKSFKYRIHSNGPTMAAGCQLRFWHITLGAGWAIHVSKPRWTGPADIFGDNLFTTTYPWKLNIQHGPRFEIGINF